MLISLVEISSIASIRLVRIRKSSNQKFDLGEQIRHHQMALLDCHLFKSSIFTKVKNECDCISSWLVGWFNMLMHI